MGGELSGRGARARRSLAALLVALSVAVLGLAGCSSSGDDGAGSKGSSSAQQGDDAAATGAAVADPACDAVTTVFARMRMRTATWSPQEQPFDRGVAARIRRFAGDVADQQGRATSPAVRSEVDA